MRLMAYVYLQRNFRNTKIRVYMRSIHKICILYCLATLILVSCRQKETSDSLFSTDSNQVVQVVADHMDSITATMYLWERANVSSPWDCIDSFPVTIGRNGLAPGNDVPGRKLEGDGNAPEGRYALSLVFSYHSLTDIHMPFEQVDSADLCVDDVGSVYYNQLVDDDTVTHKDYTSFERMQRRDAQYEYGVWVNYNTDYIVVGNGSCIFLHIWKNPGAPTSGCTAMSKENMLRLIYWLRAEKKPILVQHAKP